MASPQERHETHEFDVIAYLSLASNGAIRVANRAAADLLHVPQQNLIGRLLSSFVRQEDVAAFTKHLRKIGPGPRCTAF